MPTAAILDVDGTLVDTNYHHAVAWYRALRQHDVYVPVWRIHRHQGMGGDKLIAAVAGDDVERELGDDIRAAEKALYLALIQEVSVMDGARDLIVELKRRGHPVVLASSGKEREVDHYLDLLDVRDLVEGWTTSADVDNTKPEPDLVAAAMDKVDADDGVMVGDSPFDSESAKRLGMETIAVLTGGFSEEELSAGAVAVFASLIDLREGLDGTPLA